MVVDMVATLCRAMDMAWGWITEHMELQGLGLAHLLSLDQLLGTYDPADSKTLLLWIQCQRWLYNLLLCHGTLGAAYGGFGGDNGMDHFGGTVWGLGMGMSNGGGTPGGMLSVGRFEFDDVSPQFPATSDVPCGDSVIAPPALATATGWLEVVWVGRPGGHRLAVGDFLGIDELLGCSPHSVLVGVQVMRAMLLAWL